MSCLKPRNVLPSLAAPVLCALLVLVGLFTPSKAWSDPASNIRTQVQQWVAQRQGLSAEQVQLAAIDPRLKIPSCPRALQIEQPFNSPLTVKVRCADPEWQLFVRVILDAPAREALDSKRMDTVTAPGAMVGGSSGSVNAAAAVGPRRVLLATQALRRGALLSPASVALGDVSAREADATMLTELGENSYLEVVRDITPGTPLRSSDVRPAVLVKQGQLVLMTVGNGMGFMVSVRLEAMQDGRMGDQVLLRNRESGRSVTGVVIGLNQAKGA